MPFYTSMLCSKLQNYRFCRVSYKLLNICNVYHEQGTCDHCLKGCTMFNQWLPTRTRFQILLIIWQTDCYKWPGFLTARGLDIYYIDIPLSFQSCLCIWRSNQVSSWGCHVDVFNGGSVKYIATSRLFGNKSFARHKSNLKTLTDAYSATAPTFWSRPKQSSALLPNIDRNKDFHNEWFHDWYSGVSWKTYTQRGETPITKFEYGHFSKFTCCFINTSRDNPAHPPRYIVTERYYSYKVLDEHSVVVFIYKEEIFPLQSDEGANNLNWVN